MLFLLPTPDDDFFVQKANSKIVEFRNKLHHQIVQIQEHIQTQH